MELLISKLISSIIQIVLLSLIPFIWWLITARKKENFFTWLGLKKIDGGKENKAVFWIVGVTLAFIALAVFMLYSLKGVEMATSEFAGLGVSAIPAILVYAVFNTALSEEILFRGFLLKRISAKFGFIPGNLIQGALFGLIHGVMFFSVVGVLKAVIIIGFTGVLGVLMGYVNEKKAGGSIIPGWCIHAIANIFSGACAAFSVF